MGVSSQSVQRVEGGRRVHGNGRVDVPLVSIITVIFNAKDELRNLLENLGGFNAKEFEWIVIDGGSTDGTVELLRERDTAIDYWLSEPDSGIYDAMNKGVAVARGEYLLHLNEGDRLNLIPREILAECLEQAVDVASFTVLMDKGEIFYPQTGFRLRFTNTLHHQGTFYRRTDHLVYDTQYRVFGDFDLNQRLLRQKKTVRLFDHVVAYHRNDGVSQRSGIQNEIYRSARNNFGVPYVGLAFLWCKYRGVRQRVKWLATRLVSRKKSD